MRETIEGLILAGGRGSRLENKDKGLVQLQNKTLVEHVVQSISPQVNQLTISCNRNQRQYQSILDQNINGSRNTSKDLCIEDDHEYKFTGPLAGIVRFLPNSSHDYLFICPCDTPLLPINIVNRLLIRLEEAGAQACFPCDQSQKHPLILLINREIAQKSMNRLLAETPLSIVRSPSIRDWLNCIDSCELVCQDDTLVWSNINNQGELDKINHLMDEKKTN